MPAEPSERGPDCLSELALDEWLAGDGDAGERASWQAHLATCSYCQGRQASRSAENELYLAESRDLELAQARFTARPEASARTAARAKHPLRWLGSGLLAAAAGVLLLLAFGRDGEDLLERSKGSARLDFYVKSAQGVRAGQPGERVQAGDSLRFVVPRSERRYLVVLGRDSRGVVSVYFPTGTAAERADSGSELLGSGLALGASVLLDDAPGEEQLYGVFCDGAEPAASLAQELSQHGQLLPRPGCEVAGTSIRKEPP